jgi:hypothetical protein
VAQVSLQLRDLGIETIQANCMQAISMQKHARKIEAGRSLPCTAYGA